MKLLFVEDNATFAQVVSEHFLAEHAVKTVASVREALKNLPSSFDAILVDFDLPDGKGDSVVRAFRARNPDVLIVGTSAHDDGNRALRRAGANAICKKDDFHRIGEILRAKFKGHPGA